VELGRAAGALQILPIALDYQACAEMLAGNLAVATDLIYEAIVINEAIGEQIMLWAPSELAAWRGDETIAVDLLDGCLRKSLELGTGRSIGQCEYARAVLYNGLGRYDAALTAASLACEHDDLGLYGRALSELVESAVRSGNSVAAADALTQLAEQTDAAGTDWALGIQARARALTSDGDQADDLYRVAIQRLSRTRVRVELARAHLVYGEWLRRENRRVDAREQLRVAHEMFTTIGAEAFAERSGRELLATGETARKRGFDVLQVLTPQEAQIARLAGERRTNSEIASQLYLSPRTVEYHLSKVFPKLGITSRRELQGALQRLGQVPAP
jgi:DNA-binding CsgD family transcriptional regulator